MPRPGPSFWAPSSTRSYQRYVDFLIAAPGYSAPFQVLLALFYGVEVAIRSRAWGRLEVREPYAEFIARWTHEDFQAAPSSTPRVHLPVRIFT